jgi:hypothetical protein
VFVFLPPPPSSPLDLVNGHVLGASDIHSTMYLKYPQCFSDELTKYRIINTEEEHVACIHTFTLNIVTAYPGARATWPGA